jgi:hypothetical protein
MYRVLLMAAAILTLASPAYAIDYDPTHLTESPQPDWERITEHAQSILNPEPAPSVAPTPRATVTPKPSRRAGKLSEAEVRTLLENACAKYGVATDWIVPVGLQVAWRESTYNPGAVSASGTYVGLFQFGPPWGGEERFSAEWSANRFVKVYADGGKAKIRQHWRATVGGM